MVTAISTENTSQKSFPSFCYAVLLVLFFCACLSFATEPLKAIAPPQSNIFIAGLGELRDDVYSADLKWSIELSPCNCLSIYTDMSYRFISYEWQTMFHDQIHEMVDLRVNGLNESFVGMKIFPLSYMGINLNWRFQPGEGSRIERFQRLGVEPMVLYPFSKNLLLGFSASYYTFIEDENFQPGDELGVKTSFVYNFRWKAYNRTGWKLDYVFLFRWRIEESKNLNLKKQYQKMDDLYRGFRMRGGITRYVNLFPFPFGFGFAYEMNRGHLFGFETGHKIELNLKAEFP